MTLFLCISGTDTDAGKTLITAGLARLGLQKGLRTLVIKPVQTGALPDENGLLRAPDLDCCAALAPGASTVAVELFAEACSPHLAARLAGKTLTANDLARSVRSLVKEHAPDLALLEGAGGLLTPISEQETLADLFAALGWPLLLVADNKLGAVNHALLSLETARNRGLTCLGLVSTQSTPAGGAAERRLRRDNSGIITSLGKSPCLADIAHDPALHAAEPALRDSARDRLAAFLAPVLEALKERPAPPSQSALLDFDRAHIWHPYTSCLKPLRAWEAVKTTGTRILLQDGRELIDGMASWWCAIHGYRHPALMQALHSQAGRMPHVMFGGLTHEPAVGLARRLLDMAPAGLEHVFFADSGSVAVEVAVKMALQYQQATGQRGRSRLLTVRGGYHGDTLGAMSVCDPETGMHGLFSGILPAQLFAPRPECRFDAPYDPAPAAALEALLKANESSVAALILEPIVQGAGGMWFYHPDYLRRARELCAQHGCLLILDEIATGFGRTGAMFACEHAGVAPDILCLGKGLTGGVMSLAATLATRRVAEGISQGDGVLMHGPTYMGNPLACAVAGTSLDLLADGSWKEGVRRIERGLQSGLAPCAEAPGVADVRVLGAIGVVEMDSPVDTEKLQRFFVDEHGVWIRPFGRLIYVMPPYVTDENEVAALCRAIVAALEEARWK